MESNQLRQTAKQLRELAQTYLGHPKHDEMINIAVWCEAQAEHQDTLEG